MKMQLTEWEKIFAHHISHKGLMSKMYKKTHTSEHQKINQLKNGRGPEETCLQRV